eukprot:TRINITY_DN41248_c0_g1_i1.p1 TRINITY_DN41248_c0_g1~~TRINITY_DN41248_c0_g1_i1.p1  ORF type:complete len:302 (-),score=68.13 TRINITY_DN41248_c0_g1_i1:249-1154(-)
MAPPQLLFQQAVAGDEGRVLDEHLGLPLQQRPQPAARTPPLTSFLKDCSFRTPDGLTGECRRLRDLFVGKELIGRDIKVEGMTCGFVPEYPDPRRNAKLPVGREEFIHDTQTDLWYHCCEYRPRYGRFSVDVEGLRHQGSQSALGQLGSIYDRGPIPEEKEEPVGPLLQCNLMENLKHRMGKDGKRAIYDKISELGGTVGQVCRGDEAVALRRFAGVRQSELKASLKDMGLVGHKAKSCVDTGSYGNPTPTGKMYHVFELTLPDPSRALLLAVAPKSLEASGSGGWEGTQKMSGVRCGDFL